MVTRAEKKEAPIPKKAQSSARAKPGRKTRKLTVFNKFMKTELLRLKETQPDLPHKERFSAAVESWKKSKAQGS